MLDKKVLYVTYEKSGNGVKHAVLQYLDSDLKENITTLTPTTTTSEELVAEEEAEKEEESMQLQQLIDQDGNPISLTTQDGQQVKVIASIQDGQEKIQGLLADGTLIPIDLDSTINVSHVFISV